MFLEPVLQEKWLLAHLVSCSSYTILLALAFVLLSSRLLLELYAGWNEKSDKTRGDEAYLSSMYMWSIVMFYFS